MTRMKLPILACCRPNEHEWVIKGTIADPVTQEQVPLRKECSRCGAARTLETPNPADPMDDEHAWLEW